MTNEFYKELNKKIEIMNKIVKRMEQMQEAIKMLEDKDYIMNYSEQEVMDAKKAFVMEGKAYLDGMLDGGAISGAKYEKLMQRYFGE